MSVEMQPPLQLKLATLENGLRGYNQICQLAEALDGKRGLTVQLDFSAVRFIPGNMLAPLGAILHRTRDAGNSIFLTRVARSLHDKMYQTGFFPTRQPANEEVTLPFKRFEPHQEKQFAAYTNIHLKRQKVAAMPPELLRKFFESVDELYNNASLHSKTEHGVFACGQLYRRRHFLLFAIVDLGFGIKQVVNNWMGSNFEADRAIEWCLETGNTTRSGDIPGGLGLKIINEFIIKNRGSLFILSDTGFLQIDGSIRTKGLMRHRFPGTVVTMKIITSDITNYFADESIDLGSIF